MTPSSADKRKLIVAAVAAGALVVAGAAFALNRTQADTAPVSRTEPIEAPAAEPATGSAEPTTAARPPAAGEVAAGGATAGSKPPSQTEPRTAPERPSKPAAAGEELKPLPAPPEKTLAMLSLDEGFSGAQYEITFEPFGYGPTGDEAARLVVLVSASKPLDAGAKALDRDFSGRNVALMTSRVIVREIAKGGQYTGTIEVRPQGDVGVLYLLDAKAK